MSTAIITTVLPGGETIESTRVQANYRRIANASASLAALDFRSVPDAMKPGMAALQAQLADAVAEFQDYLAAKGQL